MFLKWISRGFKLKVTLMNMSGESKDINQTPHMNECMGVYLTEAA